MDFQLVASQLVLQEISAGDQEAATDRLKVIEPLELLSITGEALDLANALVQAGAVPKVAAEDALHIAIAVTNGVEFLLTWNHKHLANAVMRGAIDRVCRAKGYEPAIICTPEELLEG